MKIIIQFPGKLGPWLLLASLVLLSSGSAIHAQLKPGTCNEYVGKIGKGKQIGMGIWAAKDGVEGSYFYKQHLQDLPLTGNYTAARDISLVETDSSNQPRGTFLLHFAEKSAHFETTGSLQGEVLQGDWVSVDGKTQYPTYLQIEHECELPGQSRHGAAGAIDDGLVEKNAQAFYNAVVSGKRIFAAKYVSYPATFFEKDKQSSIRSSTEFVKLYAQIFTSGFVTQIRKGTPHHMFANSQGIMLGDGEVWFEAEGKAKHFNNELRTQ